MFNAKSITFLVGILGVSIPLMILSAFNTQAVELNYIIGTISLPLPLLIFTAFGLGILIMLVLFGLTGFVWKARAKSLEKQIDKLHKDNQARKIEAEFRATRSE